MPLLGNKKPPVWAVGCLSRIGLHAAAVPGKHYPAEQIHFVVAVALCDAPPQVGFWVLVHGFVTIAKIITVVG